MLGKMVSFYFMLNFRLQLFYFHMIIMVSCEIGRHPDEGNIHHDYQHQNVLNEVREVNDLKEILLDEDSVVNFPIQENDHIKWINIPESISLNHCKKFGLELLGFGRTLDVDSIVEQHQDLACEMILFKWLNMEGASNEPITFRTLIEVIHKLGEKFGNGYNELANKIKFTAEVHQTIDIGYIPASVKTYSSQLFERYQKDNVIDISQWIPKRLDQKIQNITFVDLELKEHNNDDFLELDDLLRDIQDGMKILFTGRPGVGKTTITRYLSKRMRKFKHFVLIIKLHLGDLNGPINDLDTLLKIQGDKSFLPADIARISNYTQRTNGKDICFLLDGYDEYAPSRHGNYINSLIKGEELTKSVVIVTSRPNAVGDIMYLFQRKIEIFGFAESRITTYLNQLQLSGAQYETIYQYLNNHPNVRQMCYLPLHLSMFVYVATKSSALTFISTETELYYNFLALTIKSYKKVPVESLNECFSDPDTQTNVCVILRSISKIALDGLMNRTQMFTSSSLIGLSPRIANVSAEIEALSLFKIETSYDEGGIEFYKYWYSHPTFQEFLAAFHLTTLPRENHFEYVHLDYGIFRTDGVYKYYFGLIRRLSKYDDNTIMAMFIKFSGFSYIMHRYFYVMKCAHEAGHDSKFILYLQAAGIISHSNSLYINLVTHNSYDDCWYLGYILAQTSLHELQIRIRNHQRRRIPDVKLCLSCMIKYLKNDARFSGDANVTKFVIKEVMPGYFLHGPKYADILEIIDLGFLSIFQRRSTFLQLFLVIKQYDSLLQVEKILRSFKMLHGLSLMVDISFIEEVNNILQNLSLLKHLELVVCYHGGAIPASSDVWKFKDLVQLQSLSIIFEFHSVDHFNAAGLLNGWKHLINLEILNIRWRIVHTGQKETILGIQEDHNYGIKNLALDLFFDDHDYQGRYRGSEIISIRKIAKALSSLRLFLKNLSLHIEIFSTVEHVMIELADGLGNLTKLQELSLNIRRNSADYEILDKGAIVLADKLKHLNNLRALNLNLENSVNYDELMVLFSSLTNLSSLNLMSSLGARFEKNDIKKLLSELKYLKQLQILDLSGNVIRDDDMEPLIEALKEMSNLHTLDLSRNEIGDHGIKLLAELFEHPQQYLCNLKVLNLDSNHYSVEGAEILAEKLRKLLLFHTIEISGNYKLKYLNAEFFFLKHQQKVPVIWPQQTSVFKLILSVILGIIVLVGVSLIFKSKASSKKVKQSTELSRALTYSSFSVSDAWYLKRLECINLKGTGTVIAILDTTINQSFPSFTEKKILPVAINESFPSLTGEEILVIDCLPSISWPVASDLHATMHGTICSAIAVGSKCDTTSGVIPRGVAPGARLIVYRIAEGEHFPFEAILSALDDIWNRLQSNIQIDVVSISYHYNVKGQQLQIFHDKIQKLTEMGITFVAAAGNRGGYQALACIPARFNNVISVGALNKNGKLSSLTPQVKIDVYAPGEDLEFPLSDKTYAFWGTSYATPAAAGLVLLLKELANSVGSPAKENIHRAEILREIFKQDMFVRSDCTDKHIDPLEPVVRVDSDGTVVVFEPVEFLMSIKDNPMMLNVIVQKYFTKMMEIIQATKLSRALTCSSFSVSDAWYLNRLECINLKGTGTVIAILDTTINENFLPCFRKNKILPVAINESFPSLTGEEILVIDCLPGIPVASNMDATMHGTICSAIAVGSQCDTTSGVIPRGVAPGAQLIVYRIAEGKHFPFEAILRALDDIWNRLQSNIGIDVVSISYHYEVMGQQLQLFHDKIQKLTEMGITFAAGNSGYYQGLACIPACFNNVISVGAVNKYGKKSPITPHVKIDVYAPGDDLKFVASDDPFWGTSYATPAAAGLVLLLKEWANFVGSPAKENIHRPEILREIFKHDMYKETDSTDKNIDPLEPLVRVDSDGKVVVFQPVKFFMDMKDNPMLLNVIVQKYLPVVRIT